MVVIEPGSRRPTEQDVAGSSSSTSGAARGGEDYRGGEKRSAAMEIEENGDPHDDEPSHLSLESTPERDAGFLKPVVRAEGQGKKADRLKRAHTKAKKSPPRRAPPIPVSKQQTTVGDVPDRNARLSMKSKKDVKRYST